MRALLSGGWGAGLEDPALAVHTCEGSFPTIYEIADPGTTVLPIKSRRDLITSPRDDCFGDDSATPSRYDPSNG